MKQGQIHFFPYNRLLIHKARENRKDATPMENKIWYEILSGERLGYKFLRQKPILNFILDFYCSKLLLGIEIDADSHGENQAYDAKRTDLLATLGIKILRYTNSEVMENIEGLFDDLSKQIEIREQELRAEPPISPFSGGFSF